MRYALFFLSIFFLFSCGSKKIILNPNSRYLIETIYFEDQKINSSRSTNEQYQLTKEVTAPNYFNLIHNNSIFFKALEKDRYFIFEVFDSKFLLISHIPSPNNYASPYNGKRDKTYLYDLENSKLYYFKTIDYLLSPIRNGNPLVINKESRNKQGTIDAIDIENRSVIILLADLVTYERLELISVKDNIGIE